jgi:nicotinamidase-related amidase
MRALINVDYTHDFVIGALPVGQPALDIEERITEITQQFMENGDLVVFALDAHYDGDETHPEYKLFPPHNIVGTPGRNVYGALGQLLNAYSDDHNMVVIDKTRYNAFWNTGLTDILAQRGITEVHLVGVCTDICVLHTAVGAYEAGFDIVVHADACNTFVPGGHEWALNHFKGALGATIMNYGQRV